jgi:hypothetical protein
MQPQKKPAQLKPKGHSTAPAHFLTGLPPGRTTLDSVFRRFAATNCSRDIYAPTPQLAGGILGIAWEKASGLMRLGAALSCLPACLAKLRRRGQRKDHHLFAGRRTDIVVQAQGFDTRDVVNKRFQGTARGLDKLCPHLLEQIPAFFSGQRADEMLLGRGEHSLQAHDEQIADQVRSNVLGPAAHVLLLEARNPIADRGFDFALCSVHCPNRTPKT